VNAHSLRKEMRGKSFEKPLGGKKVCPIGEKLRVGMMSMGRKGPNLEVGKITDISRGDRKVGRKNHLLGS